MHYDNFGRKFVTLLCSLVVVGCSGSNSGDSVGTISVSLMDRPVDGVTALYVTIDEVWVKPQGDQQAFPLPMAGTPMPVDLLSLTDQNAAMLVEEAVVDAGIYNWVELKIDDSEVGKSYAMTKTGGEIPVDVDVPSDKIRLVGGFEVGENQAVRFLFDWEVGKGLTEAVGRELYILKPAFRILRADEFGSISGKLTNATAVADSACNNLDPKVVYIFEGAAEPDGKDLSDPEPVTTVYAKYDIDTNMAGDFLYRAVVMPGDYKVVLSCLGSTETDDLMFLSPLLPDDNVVTVTAGNPVEGVDF